MISCDLLHETNELLKNLQNFVLKIDFELIDNQLKAELLLFVKTIKK